jgi:mediator of RNA polymerase II transcription subunit 18, fungi type
MFSESPPVRLTSVDRFVTEYVVEGHRLVHSNIVLRLQRVLQFPGGSEGLSSPRSSFPSFDSLNVLDESGAYMLQAAIRLQDGTKPELVTNGVGELNALKADLKGIVDLQMVERLSMDTRVK